MSKQEKKVLFPEKRFPEFQNKLACKRMRLSDLLFETKLRNRELKYSKNDVLSVSGEYGCVNQIEFKGRSYAGVSVKDYRIADAGDIIYTKSPLKNNPYGIIKANKGKSGIVSTLYAVYRTTEISLPEYLDHYFSLESNLNRYLQPLVNKGAKNDMKVKNSDVLTGEIFIPEPEEQKKISQFLSSSDELIIAQAKKLDALKAHKNGLMQTLFPAEGETIPKFRFPDFRDEEGWVNLKVSSILKKVSNPVEVSIDEQYRQIGIRSHGKGIFHKDSVSGEKLGNKRVFWVVEDALIVNIVFAWERAVASTTKSEKGMIASHRFPMYRPYKNKSVIAYIKYFFLTHGGKELLLIASPGGAGRNKTLGQKSFENLEVLIPKSIKEQQKVANCLSSIDASITLQEKKVEALKSYKKGLMQQLFPAIDEVIA